MSGYVSFVLNRIAILTVLVAAMSTASLRASDHAEDADHHADHKVATSAPVSTNEHASSAHEAASDNAVSDKAAGPEEVWNQLMVGNARFVAGKPKQREYIHTRRELAKGQHPHTIVITCADSRVSPELVFDANLGELFVLRTAGNIADPIVLGSIEYAVEHCHSTAIVVLGHTKCGAVTAAASGGKMPSPNLEAIVNKIGPALAGIESRDNMDEFVRKGVETNVHWVVRDMLKNSDIIRSHFDEQKIGVFRAVYQLETGEVVQLK